MKQSAFLNLFVLTPVFAGVVLSFQNCSPVVFQEMNLASTETSLELCVQNPADPKCIVVTPAKCKFNGKEYSSNQSVVHASCAFDGTAL